MFAFIRASAPRVVSGLAILAVAMAAGVISYQHVEDLTLRLHGTLLAARLMPVGVDGLIAVGSMVLLQGGMLGWVCIGPGVVISVFANVESGIRYGTLAAVWAGIPAVSFALASYVLERWLKGQTRPSQTTQQVTETETVADAPADALPGAPEPASDSVDAPAPASVRVPASVTVPGVHDTPETEIVPDAPRRAGMSIEEAVLEFAAEVESGELPSLRQIGARAHTGRPRAQQIQDRLAARIAARPKPVGALTAGRVRAIVRESASTYSQ